MKTIAIVLCLATFLNASGEERFGRPVLSVKNEKSYSIVKLDDAKYATLSSDRASARCLVFRGTENYYVEVSITNTGVVPISLPSDFVTFDKPGYTSFRDDTMAVARDIAASANLRFVGTPPPYVPPTYRTTVNTTSSTYGNQTTTSGTLTSSPDYSGQAGANFGNAIGNALAARQFRKGQRNDAALSSFLATHSQGDYDSPLPHGQSRTVVAVFSQSKSKKAPFLVTVKIAGDTFIFRYKG